MEQKDVLVAEWVISHSKMCKIVKLLNSKKHAHRKYWFEVEDLGMNYKRACQEFFDQDIYDSPPLNWVSRQKPMVKMRVYRPVNSLKALNR